MNELTAPQPLSLVLSGTKKSLWTLWKEVPFEYKMEFKPLSILGLNQVANIIMSISPKSSEGENYSTIAFSLTIAVNHADKLAEVVAIAVERFPGRKRNQLKKLLLSNTTPEELAKMFHVVVEMMDLANFLKAIVSVRGISILGNTEKPDPGNMPPIFTKTD